MTETTQAMQQYSGFELDDAEALDEEMSKGVSEWMKWKVGKNVVRFLPAPVGQKPFVLVLEHQLNIAGKFINFACPRQMAKKACPVCRKIDEKKTTGNPADYERAKEWFPRKRIYAYCIDRVEPEMGPKIVAVGKQIWEQLKQMREDVDFGGDFTHPITGFDVVVNRKGTSKHDTEYLCKPTRQSELGNDEWLAQVGDLSRFGRLFTEKEILEKLGSKQDNDQSGSKERFDDSSMVDALFVDVGDDDDTPL